MYAQPDNANPCGLGPTLLFRQTRDMYVPTVLFLGSGGVGKTAIIRRLLYNQFDERYLPSVEEHHTVEFLVGRRMTKVELIDTSGLFPNSLHRRAMIADSAAIVLVYSVNNRISFDNVSCLVGEITEAKQAKSPQRLPLVVLGNKSDLVTREVGRAEAAMVAKYEWFTEHFETSALEGWNVIRPISEALEKATRRRHSSVAVPPNLQQSPED
ncbi:GTP-binding protein Di-Ras1-like [Glandiceps talaboti]